MTEKQIISKKRKGDMVLVAEILTKQLDRYISPMNAGKLIERKSAQNHQPAIDALQLVVESREKILQNV